MPESEWIEHKPEAILNEDDIEEYDNKDTEKIEKNLATEEN